MPRYPLPGAGFAVVLSLGLGACAGDRAHVVHVCVPEQRMTVFEHGRPIARYPVSTSKFGVGDVPGSNCTPLGKMAVAKKIGAGAPLGMKFKSRQPTGEIVAVNARLSRDKGMHCWFVDVEFASGALGHLDLTVAVRMDWHEGFQIYGQYGSIVGKTYNPWYFKTSDVDIFRERDGVSYRPLGADGHFYRRQLEGFADAIITDGPLTGADIADGVASVRAMLAIARSAAQASRVRLDEVTGRV